MAPPCGKVSILRGRFLFCFGQLLIAFHQFGHTGTFTGPGFGALYKAVSIHHRTVILPLLFLSGDADPVGEQGKGVRRAIQSLKDAGVQNIESIFYPGARHELLVETNKLEVFGDIAAWLDKQLAKQ